jgi:hypothetical protein
MNIHIVQTDQPSDLLLCIKSYLENDGSYAENSDTIGNFRIGVGKYADKSFYNYQQMYITDDSKIKEGDWVFNIVQKTIFKVSKQLIDLNIDPNVTLTTNKKIILTTDVKLIADGVQVIPNEFLEWFVKNPSCASVKVEITEISCIIPNFGDVVKYRIVIPKEEQKQHLIEIIKSDEELGMYEETAEEYFLSCIKNMLQYNNDALAIRFMEKYYHAKKEQDKESYNDEQVKKLLIACKDRFGGLEDYTHDDVVKE